MPRELKNMKKNSSIWRLRISSYRLPNLIEQVWLCLLERHWSGIKRAKVLSTSPVLKSSASKVYWLQNYLLPPSWWTTPTWWILKMPDIRTKKACTGAFPTIISLPQSEFHLTPKAEMLLYFITLGRNSPHTFPVITWIHSSVSPVFSFCTLLHFLTTTKLPLSQICITALASSEGCQLRAHHYHRQD